PGARQMPPGSVPNCSANRSAARSCGGVTSGCRVSTPHSLFQVVNHSLPGCNRDAMDDDGLIALVAAGDDSALRALFSRHAPWLAARLRAALPAADVEDVLQETFIAVWRGAGGYRPDGTAGGWLWGIARRQAALLLRRRGPAAAVLFSQVASDQDVGDPADTVPDRVDLDRAVAALGPPGGTEREAWRLLYLED